MNIDVFIVTSSTVAILPGGREMVSIDIIALEGSNIFLPHP